MTEQHFFGNWNVQVLHKDAWFDERFVVTGSDTADGAYMGIPGAGPGPVTGGEWIISMEWNDNAGSGWRPSDIRRTADYTIADGLVVFLGADDNYPALRDGDYNDMIVVCRNLDPSLQPLHPLTNPYDFSLPRETLEKYLERERRESVERNDEATARRKAKELKRQMERAVRPGKAGSKSASKG